LFSTFPEITFVFATLINDFSLSARIGNLPPIIKDQVLRYFIMERIAIRDILIYGFKNPD
jgi:hypothetical protein